MDDQHDRQQLLARLDKIETTLRHIKMLLLGIVVILLAGLFGASVLLEATLTFLIGALLLIGIVYAGLWFLWGMTRLRFAPTPDQELREAVLGKTADKKQ